MYSFTRVWIGAHDAMMQIGMMKVVSSTNGHRNAIHAQFVRIACENQSRSSTS